MGAGRRTETVNFNGHLAGGGSTSKAPLPQRKLAEKNKLGSVIFGCTNATYSECVTNKLFGLPWSHRTYVEHILPGMPLFLFNYTERKMYGIFEATSEGAVNINASAWTGTDTAQTQYPSQVRVQLRSDFKGIVSLTENVFSEPLKDNYHTVTHFCFELDFEQTEKLIKLFERAAGNSYRPVVQRNFVPNPVPNPVPNAWQTAHPKIWKKTNGSGEIDEKLKLKKPASIVMSEWDRGAQYFPSSSKEVASEELPGPHLHPAWSRKSSNGEDDLSDGSEDLHTIYKPLEVTTESEMRRVMSNEKSDREPAQVKAPGYRPKLVGAPEPAAYTPDEENSNEADLTEAQQEEKQRVYERLRRLATGAKETPEAPESQPVQIPPGGETVLPSVSNGMPGWERLARERSMQEQAALRDDREKVGATLSGVDSTVAITLKKNLEVYAMAIAQIRQDGIELRRLLDDAKLREENRDSMAAELEALKLEVADLKRQIAKPVAQDRFDQVLENGAPPKTVVEMYNAQAPDIYLIGGLGDQLSKLESVMVWSPSTDKLRTAATMLTPRCCAAASVLDGHIFVFGGGDGAAWYDTVEKYDRRKDQWLSCASMKTKRGSLGGAAIGNRIFAIGGGNGQSCFSDVESYDPCLGGWLPSTSMHEKRFCVAATECGGALYALGGFDGEQYLKSMERFDPREGIWTRLPSMKVKRGSLSAAVLNGKIYALGGYDGDGILDDVEIFDPRAERWDKGLAMCCRRAYGAAAVVGEAMYYMGGLVEDEAVDSERRSTDVVNGSRDDEADQRRDGGYRSWRSQWQASWQQCILGESVPGLTINPSHQIQRFTEAGGWQSMRPRVIGKRSCLAAAVL